MVRREGGADEEGSLVVLKSLMKFEATCYDFLIFRYFIFGSTIGDKFYWHIATARFNICSLKSIVEAFSYMLMKFHSVIFTILI